MVEMKLRALIKAAIDSADNSDSAHWQALTDLAGYVPPLSQKGYVDCEGLNCPYCQATGLAYDDDLSSSGTTATLRCACETCHMVWEERYELAGYTVL